MNVSRLVAIVLLASAILLPAAANAQAVSDEAVQAKRPPKLLSEFGFFADMTRQTPVEGVVPFALNTPLFSDKALKYRFVYVPEGTAARYVADEAFEFPVGTALIKTFAFPADFREPDNDIRLIETRVLLNREDGWQAWAYLWNERQNDAELKIAGARVPIETIDEDGSPLSISYSVPNKNQCKGCHALNEEITPLGPKARNLNGEFDYDDGTRNQIEYWTGHGLLEGAPPSREIATAPDWRDGSADLEGRARAWLDVNCAHCHRREGPASNSGLFLTWDEQDRTALGVLKRPVAAGRGSGDREFDIKPGDPDGSILLYRVESTEPGVMMPELGRSLADPDATELLREWISSISG